MPRPAAASPHSPCDSRGARRGPRNCPSPSAHALDPGTGSPGPWGTDPDHTLRAGLAWAGESCHPLPAPPQEVVSHCKKLTRKNKEQLSDMMELDKQKGLKSLSKEKRQKLEAYQHLFYLLQVSGGLGRGSHRLLRPPCPCHCLQQDVLLRNPTASPRQRARLLPGAGAGPPPL